MRARHLWASVFPEDRRTFTEKRVTNLKPVGWTSDSVCVPDSVRILTNPFFPFVLVLRYKFTRSRAIVLAAFAVFPGTCGAGRRALNAVVVSALRLITAIEVFRIRRARLLTVVIFSMAADIDTL